MARRLGTVGDMIGDAPYEGAALPVDRSGLAGNTGIPGDMASLEGEPDGSIGTGDSLRRANLAVERW